MRMLDIPPVWLLACLVIAWSTPGGLPPLWWTGASFLVLAALVMAAAILALRRAGTTIVPRERATALVTGGIYRLSRNPIYVADLLILAGAALMRGSLIGIVLVPLLMILLDWRFVRGEETGLEAGFGEAFRAYRARTRRWI